MPPSFRGSHVAPLSVERLMPPSVPHVRDRRRRGRRSRERPGVRVRVDAAHPGERRARVRGPRLRRVAEVDDVVRAVARRRRVDRDREAVAVIGRAGHAGGGALGPRRALIGAHEHADGVRSVVGPDRRNRDVQDLDPAGRPAARSAGARSSTTWLHRRAGDGSERGRNGARRRAQDLRPVLAPVGGLEHPAAADAGIQDPSVGRRARVEDERARVAAAAGALRPVQAGVGGSEDTERRGRGRASASWRGRR